MDKKVVIIKIKVLIKNCFNLFKKSPNKIY